MERMAASRRDEGAIPWAESGGLPAWRDAAILGAESGLGSGPVGFPDQLCIIPGAPLCIMAMLVPGATTDAAGTVATLILTTAMPDRSGPATPAVKAIFLARSRAICMATPYTSSGTADPV